MAISVINGIIKRRLLVNYRANPQIVQRLLPFPFRPKLHRGHAIVGICLIRLEQMRPLGLPASLGISSENAAHRLAVEWSGANGATSEGVFVPRRDTNSLLNRLAGGRLFPGPQNAALFHVSDQPGRIDFSLESADRTISVKIVGTDADELPSTSCFSSFTEASAFFAGGSLGYSPPRSGGHFDGIFLQTDFWRVRAFTVSGVTSSFFADPQRFPPGSIEFDHALVMRDIPHQWRRADNSTSPILAAA